MKTYIILIILGFIQLIFCNPDLNVNAYDSVCPFRLFRRKRANKEYTRWRANDPTTNQFLVKVLDEESTTGLTKSLAAVNILPATKGGDKLIIGGVKVPSPTTTIETTELLGEYSRFVPPTGLSVTEVNGELFYAPVRPTQGLNTEIVPFNQMGYSVRQPQRDDSPPASPQFIARTPLLSRKRAPIAYVTFPSRTTLGPVTPPAVKPYVQDMWDKRLRPPLLRPTRTTLMSDVSLTESFDDDFEQNMITRPSVEKPVRTTLLDITNELDPEIEGEVMPTPKTILGKDRSQDEDKKYDTDKDSDSSYNMMFYNDEDLPFGTKKPLTTISDVYKKENENLSDKESPNFRQESTDDEESKSEIEVKDIANGDIEYELKKNVTKVLPEIDIISNNKTVKPISMKPRRKEHQLCSVLKIRELNFNTPCTLTEIIVQMRQWAETSPVAKWVDITSGNFTTMENPIYMMIVDDPSSGQILSAKQTVMIVAGIQGRDHHAVSAAMYVLYQLIERSEAHTELLTKYRFWVIPVFNPDGYDYSMTFPHRRNWTKNLRQIFDTCKGRDSCSYCDSYGLRCTIQPCYGVNLDRNFEYQWIPADELRTEHQCGSLYAGPRQLSEAETQALTYFLHQQRSPLYTFIAFKEGEVLGILYPYSHTTKKRAYDQLYRQRASRAAAAAYRISNRPYVAGQTSEFLPLYAGGIEDWVDGHLGIDNSYTIMMFRPSDSSNKKLLIERIVHEAYAALDTLLMQSIEKHNLPQVTLHQASRGFRTMTTLLYVIPLLLLWNR